MPLTDELGTRVLSSLQDAVAAPPDFDAAGVTFEAWLSWIAERQPYETESEYFSNQALFASIQRAIGRVLREAQAEVEAGLPGWLYEFVDLLHFAEADVITLNYDTLLEHLVHRRGYADSRSHIRDQDLIVGFPNGAGVFQHGHHGYMRRSTLRLHKLHGSIDWYSVPGDLTGTTLERIGPMNNPELEDLEATIGGRTEFIVPPTSSKSGYFDNPKTRFIWQRSLAALRDATRVALIGYSLPITDAALASMISRALVDSPATVIVVNPEPGPVVHRLTSLGIAAERIEVVDTIGCVAQFVRDESIAASERLYLDLAQQLKVGRNAPVAVGWDHSGFASVQSTALEADGTLVVGVERFGQIGELARPGTPLPLDSQLVATMTLGQILRDPSEISRVAISYGQHRRLLAGYIEGINQLRSDHVTDDQVTPWQGTGPDDWIVLRPVGANPIE